MTTRAFSSDNPAVLGHWRACAARAKSWHDQIEVIAPQFCPVEGLERLETGFFGDREWTGFKFYGRKADIPDGWRSLGGRHDFWLVPKVSTAIGKAAKAAMADVGPLRDPREDMQGLRHDLLGQQPAMRLVDGTIWMRFGDDWTDQKDSRVDKTIWVPRTLAEYYTATEKETE